MGNKVSSGTKQYLTAAYRSTRGTRRKRVKNSTKVQEVYYVEQVLRLRKAPNYTGTKWYRGGTENMAGTNRYLYTGTYIGYEKHQNYTGAKWYRGGTENMAGTHRYLYTGTYIGTSIYTDI